MRFGLLGPVVVWSDADEEKRVIESHLSEHRARGLLAALLLRPNTFITQSALTELLWDEIPASALPNLRTYATRLRRALASADPWTQRLESLKRGADRIGGGSYLLRVHGLELDVDVFLQLMVRAKNESSAGWHESATKVLGQALGIWRGEAGGPDVAGSMRLMAQLRSFNDLRVLAQEDLITARLQLGEHRALIPDIRSLLADHPYREVSWGQLMYAYYRCGDIANSLRIYQEVRGLLAQDLGVQPGEELERLHQAILNRDDLVAYEMLKLSA